MIDQIVPLHNHKDCYGCKKNKFIQEFGMDNSKPDGKSIYCRVCNRGKCAKSRLKDKDKRITYRQENKTKIRKQSRDYILRLRYGITEIEFNQQFEKQGKKCALCDSNKSDKKNFVVDHCHKTGKIRGILCSYCNRALGMFKDSKDNLIKAIKYIEKTET